MRFEENIDSFEEFLEENAGFKADKDPSMFEEFLDSEEYIDLGHLFTIDRIFSSKDELVQWIKQTAMNMKTYLIITPYQRSRIADPRPYVTLACERGGLVKKCKKAIVDDEKETARLTEEQLHQTEQFKKGHVSPRNILRFFREQDVGCAVSVQKICNVVAKIKRNRMQRRNTVEEVLCLSAERDYTVFHRNREESNVLSDIVVAHPTLIAMIRTYNMSLLEAVGMTLIGKNFTVAIGSIINQGEPLVKLEMLKTRGWGRGCNSGRSSLSSVVNPDAPSTSSPFNNAFPGFIYEFILNWKNVVGDGSTTVLPLVSNMDGSAVTLVNGFIEEQQHFIQLYLQDGFPLPLLQVQ
ncbi:hypothetical protein M9H77_11999 [Catharanthus roseus]|uniref:Uncharacterized protein n=1 Tax=Catharanthus roseus TaxID=4058 RepID=A0ACC0BG72_CATRO|nr:hypothetical protein M9H77_11999 [Catharanthus roseus]